VFTGRVQGRRSTLPVNTARVDDRVHGCTHASLDHPLTPAVNTGRVYRAPVCTGRGGKKKLHST